MARWARQDMRLGSAVNDLAESLAAEMDQLGPTDRAFNRSGLDLLAIAYKHAGVPMPESARRRVSRPRRRATGED